MTSMFIIFPLRRLCSTDRRAIILDRLMSCCDSFKYTKPRDMMSGDFFTRFDRLLIRIMTTNIPSSFKVILSFSTTVCAVPTALPSTTITSVGMVYSCILISFPSGLISMIEPLLGRMMFFSGMPMSRSICACAESMKWYPWIGVKNSAPMFS